ncbi:DUF397 domain-containing protein [Streptomyces brevispora]|uniref:DUF397 domain-containing protein n=1 Tax=Streptomyces brevispora TaxID=887462 RepID=UPI002E3041C7|nr:DUF397 domain-containing protein [Streptomyces brevispora]
MGWLPSRGGHPIGVHEAANRVDVAAAPDGTLRLRESDDPDVILAATRAGLSALLASIKGNESLGAQP